LIDLIVQYLNTKAIILSNSVGLSKTL